MSLGRAPNRTSSGRSTLISCMETLATRFAWRLQPLLFRLQVEMSKEAAAGSNSPTRFAGWWSASSDARSRPDGPAGESIRVGASAVGKSPLRFPQRPLDTSAAERPIEVFRHFEAICW